jgi:multiple sugar transport system ATP-binding protein
MVKLKNIDKSYGDVKAVRDLTLSINEGEIFVLLGPTGAGKTTTLKITAGLVRPDNGSIHLKDRDVTEIPPAFRDISFVFENYNLFPIYNVYDNIAFALRSKLLRVENAEIEKRVKTFSEDLHISDLLDRHTSTLSGGETQRVALARALVRQAGLNLFDEPLSNLDLKLREELRVEFKELHKKYRSTIFYVTHDHDSAVSIADRIGIINEGILYQIGTPDKLIDNPNSVTVASLINYPAINIIDCTLEGNTLFLSEKTKLFELSTAEMDRIKKQTKGNLFQIGIKPRSIRIGKDKANLNFSTEVLHTEYQGYNKVINVDLLGAIVRILTNKKIIKEYGELLDINFPKNEVFLFNKEDGKRIVY